MAGRALPYGVAGWRGVRRGRCLTSPMPKKTTDTLFVILGNQLFPPAEIGDPLKDAAFFMAEDRDLCTYVRHHQQKILLFLAAMRATRTSCASGTRTCTTSVLKISTGPSC